MTAHLPPERRQSSQPSFRGVHAWPVVLGLGLLVAAACDPDDGTTGGGSVGSSSSNVSSSSVGGGSVGSSSSSSSGVGGAGGVGGGVGGSGEYTFILVEAVGPNGDAVGLRYLQVFEIGVGDLPDGMAVSCNPGTGADPAHSTCADALQPKNIGACSASDSYLDLGGDGDITAQTTQPLVEGMIISTTDCLGTSMMDSIQVGVGTSANGPFLPCPVAGGTNAFEVPPLD
jgi:hypothetical protein